MANKFGILSKLEFLQGFSSRIIAGLNPYSDGTDRL